MDLKKLRKQSHISQMQIAKALEVHLNSYSLWENGGGKPSEENEALLKNAFGIDKYGLSNDKYKEYARRKHVLEFVKLSPEEYDKKIKKICSDLDY